MPSDLPRTPRESNPRTAARPDAVDCDPELANPLRELLAAATDDPATDPRVGEWLRRLLADEAGEQVSPDRDINEMVERPMR